MDVISIEGFYFWLINHNRIKILFQEIIILNKYTHYPIMKASCRSDGANLTDLLHPNVLQFYFKEICRSYRADNSVHELRPGAEGSLLGVLVV